MANIVAQGQMTIVDLHDMPPVNGRLTSNRPKFVIVSGDKKTYSPDWSKDNLVVTAELYKAGNPHDLVSENDSNISSIKWFITKGIAGEVPLTPDEPGVVLGTTGTSRHKSKVTINRKELLTTEAPALKLRAEITYRYPGTDQSIPVSVEIDFSLVNNGANGASGAASFSAMLTNTSHVFPIASNGNVIAAETVTEAVVYEGGTKLSGITLRQKGGQSLPDGLSVLPVNEKTNALKIKASSGNLGGKSEGTILLEAVVKGKTFDLAFSWSKAKDGSNGSSPTSYWTYSNTPAIVKKWTGGKWTLDPGTITVNAMSQTGASAPGPYNGRIKIQLYKNSQALEGEGTGFVTSSGDVSTLSMTPKTTDFTHAVITLSKAGGGSKLDEEQIRVIEEPRKPVVVGVSATTDTIRNNAGSATLKVQVYRDGKDISSTATKKWVKGAGDPNTLPSISSAEEITVKATDIASSQLFRCQVEVDGSKYIDSIVIYDTTDPIQSTIQSSNGDTFKNGAGTTILTCRLWRNGAILDEPGKEFMYCWHKNNKDGVEDLNWAPDPVTEASYANASTPVVAKVSSGSGTTYVLDNVTFIRKGYKIFFNSISTAYSVTAVDTSKKQITVNAAPSGISAGAEIRVANYKKIRVTDAQVSEKATFLCELVK